MRFPRAYLALTVAVDMAGCRATTEGPSVQQITVTPNPIIVGTGDTVAITVSATDAQGNPVTGITIALKSSDTTIVRIAPGNLVIGKDSGSAGVTASTEGVSRQVPVFVYVPYWLYVSAGGDHTCGVRSDDRAYCWGANTYGQLGNGTTTPSLKPVAVAEPVHFVTTLAGGTYSCAEAAAAPGAWYCWGNNVNGQLNTGDQSNRSTPLTLGLNLGTTTWPVVGTGDGHACQTASGVIQCWGANGSGQLGSGDTGSHTGAAQVTGISVMPPYPNNSVVISAGSTHTCAEVDGSLWCWGGNTHGQLGVGDTMLRSSAVAPTTVPGAASLVTAGGSHTCAITSPTGYTYCWGENGSGQLGDGSTVDRWTPVPLQVSYVFFYALSAGGMHTCGLIPGPAAGFAAYCWGNNAHGQLGNGTTANDSVPVAVVGGRSFSEVSAGATHTCGVTPTGVAYCWGGNQFGQLGDGTTTDRPQPTPVLAP
jgi:alpha-tubulin suppressor-like RCC1 family protein